MIFSWLRDQLPRLGGHRRDFWDTAQERWELTPAEERKFPPAIFLPDQLDKIKNTVFADIDATVSVLGSSKSQIVGATNAARFINVTLIDGVLYNKSAEFHLARRTKYLPNFSDPPTINHGAVYDSWIGQRYFGNWLMDDCETYRLAEAVGKAVTIRLDSPGHRKDYEKRLAIAPIRTEFARFGELVLFDDLSNNSGKIARAADRRSRLLAGMEAPKSHNGVFLLRGRTGDPRILINEELLAEGLAARHGIHVLRAEDHSVEDLISACAGAKVVIGVEGSQLTHALAAMPCGGTMLGLFPPDRVTAAMKLMTDRLEMNFAMVIGEGTADGFKIDARELEATLDLLP